MTLKINKKFEENWSVVSKLTGIWWIFTRVLEVSKICTFLDSYCAKYLMFDLKKYRGVIICDTEEWCKIWRKTDLWFGKWHEEFGKFSPEHLKVSKLGLWWDPFIQSRKCISSKYAGELCVMTMKNDANLKRNWQFKTGMRNLTNINRALENLKNLHFNGLLLTKVYNVWAKKVQRSYVWLHWRLMQNLKENWLVLSKMTWRIWQIFTRARSKV